MLTQLIISNFAIIDHLEIGFKRGLNILSGETGAGKSIIINAVNLILGGRASADLIRTGAEDAKVEALFHLPENPALCGMMSEMDVSFDGELLIKRILSREGRNRIMINGSIATLQTLSRLGMMIISVSGQHEHQLLLKTDNHLYLLDDFGGLTDERLKLNESFHGYVSLKEDLRALQKEIRKERERQELAAYQVKEIESARITEGEDELLEEERKRLRNAEQLKGIISESYQILYEKEDSVLTAVGLCLKELEKGSAIDRRLDSLTRTLGTIRAELEEVGLRLRELQDEAVMDPFRLEEVEDRLQILHKLKRKHGPTLRDVLEFKEALSGMMNDLDRKERDVEVMKDEQKKRERDILARAAELSGKRKDAAKKLESAMEKEMNLLEMEGTRFQVDFHRNGPREEQGSENRMDSVRSDGYDRVEFMISPNIGEELRPLSRIASGGELSRIMLALKTILAKRASVETIIFDEVDSGIGGGTAEVVGEKLQSLAEYHQILCITHLPQIASKGRVHFLVKKETRNRRAQTTISLLSPDERIREIARLLGGKIVTERALAHAREMLG